VEKFTKNEIDGEELYREFQKRNLNVKDIHSIYEKTIPLEDKKASIINNTQQQIQKVVLKHQEEGKKEFEDVLSRFPSPTDPSQKFPTIQQQYEEWKQKLSKNNNEK